MKIETQLAHAGLCTDRNTGAISTPIHQTATFRHPAVDVSTGYDYSRTINPTRQVLEKVMAELEKGERGFAFASGMAAITAVLMLFASGDHIMVSNDLYGGTYRVLEKSFKQWGLSTTYVNTSRLAEVQEKIIPGKTKAILIESPTNPLMNITDLRKIVSLATENGILTIVDNTFMTPYLQQPLELGVDIVLHSGTKYLGGHNDVLSGIVVTRSSEFSDKIGFIQNSTGAILGPQDSWLMLRGIKTLALRMEKQQQNAGKIVAWLSQNPKVKNVYYPGLPEHPGFEIQSRQSRGFGAMLSFRVQNANLVTKIINRVKIITYAESLGGVETLITYPVKQTHGDIPPEIRAEIGVTEDLIRLSVGIEDVNDLIEDLDQAIGEGEKDI
ncbi:MAG TPA: methionine biosynthesis PLP-dependent protein [Firmicutes bacterium]|jgi:cystathionine beta-lyase/cystathionine gamma-synthase|nr:methionine biosynthesis PLP-dependent protein [Bacillota bacterium]